MNGKKRIRLNFAIGQYGQKSKYFGINYKVTATGDLADAEAIPEPPPTPPTPPAPPSPAQCAKERELSRDAFTNGEQSPFVNGLRAVDRNDNTNWASPKPGTENPWITVIIIGSEPVPVCRVDIAWTDGDLHPYRFNIDVSVDNKNWTNVLSNQQSSGMTKGLEPYTFQTASASFVRITITKSIPGTPFPVAQISEIRVFGDT